MEIRRFRSAAAGDYFLVVSEIVPHKRIEIAAAAAVAARQRLKVVGSGPDLDRLRALYPTVEFLGRVDDATLESLYGSALAVLVPNIEEFGIVAIEAQAAGRPVIAAKAGGALETVVEGVTGRFFVPDDVPGLTGLLRDFDIAEFDHDAIARHAQSFSPAVFHARLREEVRRAVEGAGRRDHWSR